MSEPQWCEHPGGGDVDEAGLCAWHRDAQPTPRTPDEAARAEAERRHPNGSPVAHGSFRAGFVAGSAWERALAPSDEDIAAILRRHVVDSSRKDQGRTYWRCRCDQVFRLAHQHADHQTQQIAALYGGTDETG